MVDRIRTGVIGLGHFGRYHVDKYANLERSELVAVCDTDPTLAGEVAAKHGVKAVSDYHDLFGQVDAVSVVVPTKAHHEVAKAFLENGVHVLVEKPITDDLAAADELIGIASGQYGPILQVGHLERFSSVEQVMRKAITRPLFIESYRIAPFQPRGTDVSVILDLMIHDIDLILSLVKAPAESVDAVGVPVLSGSEDIANTRIRFTNGCAANITASRVSGKNERKMRIFQPDSYISVDFLKRKLLVAQKGEGEQFPGMPNFRIDEQEYAECDKLERQIDAFLNAIANKTPPMVSGEDGRRAIETALMITESLRRHQEFVRERSGDAVIAAFR
ncbi:MAG: Gfo/Idh/MocA family oxidoreductase [Rhodospirillales bacterium]